MKRIFLVYLIFSCLPFISFGQSPLRGDIFNYDVGDEFQWGFSFDNTGYIITGIFNHLVTAKQYSATGDTVYYTYDVTNYYMDRFTWQWTTNFRVTFDTITGLNDTIYYQTMVASDPNWNNRQSVYLDSMVLNQFRESCWYQVRYAVGLGEVTHALTCWDAREYFSQNMYWYRKGNEEFGSRFVLNKDKGFDFPVRIYPNPVGDRLSIEIQGVISGEPLEFQLISMEGRVLVQNQMENPQMHLDMSDYPPGVYGIRLNGSKGSLFRKIVHF